MAIATEMLVSSDLANVMFTAEFYFSGSTWYMNLSSTYVSSAYLLFYLLFLVCIFKVFFS